MSVMAMFMARAFRRERNAGRHCARVMVGVIAATICFVALGACPSGAAESKKESFAALIARLSETGGDFGGDNLISNEQSYLRVLPAVERAGLKGGAYLGVGPDQNFTYIARVKPAIAYIVDIRRDNLLLLLWFKALFAEAPARIGYLCLLTGRPLPAKPDTWSEASIEKMIAYIDETPALPAREQTKLHERLELVVKTFGVPLSPAEFGTLKKARDQFVEAGLSLVFQVRGQPIRSYYPTLRTLLRETDGNGRQLSFLAYEEGYQFVRGMQARDLIVPVVGDVSGPKAMAAIAGDMKARGLVLSAFYISNVEYYLFRPRGFGRYVENMQGFPRDERTLVIRSVFPSSGLRLPESVAGHYSTSIVQNFSAMMADVAGGKYGSYSDLILARER